MANNTTLENINSLETSELINTIVKECKTYNVERAVSFTIGYTLGTIGAELEDTNTIFETVDTDFESMDKEKMIAYTVGVTISTVLNTL